MTGKTKKAFLPITTAVAGVLGFALFMSMPETWKGILAYAAILAVVAVVAIAFTAPRTGYWPDRHDDH